MTREEALRLCEVFDTADGDCPYCARDLAEVFNKKFPELDFTIEPSDGEYWWKLVTKGEVAKTPPEKPVQKPVSEGYCDGPWYDSELNRRHWENVNKTEDKP